MDTEEEVAQEISGFVKHVLKFYIDMNDTLYLNDQYLALFFKIFQKVRDSESEIPSVQELFKVMKAGNLIHEKLLLHDTSMFMARKMWRVAHYQEITAAS